MTWLNVSLEEEARHLKAIKRLAAEFGFDLSTVKNTYKRELARLQKGARVRDYLPLLTSRHTLEKLQRKANS